jgi:opacity protein-like surface antigen
MKYLLGGVWYAAIGALALGIGLLGNVYLSDEAAAANWTGCYVGGVGSYNALVQDEYGIGAQGPAIAATAGCDIQRGALVGGVLAEYGFGQFDIGGETLDTEGYAVGIRGGVVVWDTTLLYGLIKWTDVDLSADGYSGEASLTGPVVGAGVEVPLGAGFYTRLEYNYGLLELEESGYSDDINTHSGRLGFVYKFGGIEDAFGGSRPLK